MAYRTKRIDLGGVKRGVLLAPFQLVMIVVVCILLITVGYVRGVVSKKTNSKQSFEEQKQILPGKIPTPTVNTILPTSVLPTPITLVSPIPVQDPDPVGDCTSSALCGGKTVQIRKSECIKLLCCTVSPNEYEELTRAECDKKQAEYYKKQNEEYEKELKDYEEAVKTYEESMKQYAREREQLLQQQDVAESLRERNDQLEQQRKLSYDSCVKSAQQKALASCSFNNTCDSTGYGSPDWIARQLIEKCKETYGY